MGSPLEVTSRISEPILQIYVEIHDFGLFSVPIFPLILQFSEREVLDPIETYISKIKNAYLTYPTWPDFQFPTMFFFLQDYNTALCLKIISQTTRLRLNFFKLLQTVC